MIDLLKLAQDEMERQVRELLAQDEMVRYARELLAQEIKRTLGEMLGGTEMIVDPPVARRKKSPAFKEQMKMAGQNKMLARLERGNYKTRLGKVLITHMTEFKISMGEMGELVGVSGSTVSAWCNGRNCPYNDSAKSLFSLGMWGSKEDLEKDLKAQRIYVIKHKKLKK